MILSRNIIVALAALVLCLGNSANADSQFPGDERSVQGLIAGGFTFGGDDIFEATYTDGTTDELTGGGLLDIKLGLIYNISEDFSLQTSIGYHFDSLLASNGDGDFTRLPIDALVFHNFGKHRIGAGITLHNSPELDADSAELGLDVNIEYENATGTVLEYGYKTSDKAILALRYVDIEYETKNFSVHGTSTGFISEPDGSHVGLYMYLLF